MRHHIKKYIKICTGLLSPNMYAYMTADLSPSPGEKALLTTPSPDSKSTFNFSRKHKRIPAALKEVTITIIGMITMHPCTVPVKRLIELNSIEWEGVSKLLTVLYTVYMYVCLNHMSSLVKRSPPTQTTPPWVVICKGQRPTRSRAGGCGSSSKTKYSIRTPQVR